MTSEKFKTALEEAGFSCVTVWTAREPWQIQDTIFCYNIYAADGTLVTAMILREFCGDCFTFYMSEADSVGDEIATLGEIAARVRKEAA